ncbi:MAG: SpoIIE family protein phosphatase [Phycisphaerales bacterium]|nr:SpoIIE family protein phosphatase [Phycisphaerales bacterium]
MTTPPTDDPSVIISSTSPNNSASPDAPPLASGASRSQIAPDPSPRAEGPLSITDFMTDGSLAGLCAELTRLAGVRVELRDRAGRAIIAGEGRRAWEVVDAVLPDPADTSATRLPLRVSGETIGWILLADGRPQLSADARARLEHVISLIGSTAAELCEHGLELRHRLRELTVLYGLNSLLTRTQDVDSILDTALDSALDVLELDAGAIMLLPEDADGVLSEHEKDLVTAASRNLTDDWLKCPLPLSKDRLFDRLALHGETVTSEDVTTDDRVLIPERARQEGLVSFINAGLVFQGRPIGVIRLYKRRRREFSDWDRRLLKSIAQQAAVAVQQARLQRAREEEKRIQRQVQLAADVQRRMLPRGVPSIKGLDIAAAYDPSFELGGDFYDFVELGGHMGLIVGDVVGKGIAAALLMSAVRAMLRAHAEDIYDLDEVVRRVNKAVCRDTLDHEFATLWYGVLDPATLRMTYCSAGHEPPMVVHVPTHRPPNTTDIDELNIGGMVVGVDPSQRYQRGLFELRPGDVLFAYTDGVTDASTFSGEKFGKKRLRATLLRLLAENPRMPARQIVDQLLWEVRRFVGLARKIDDQTLVVVRILDKP